MEGATITYSLAGYSFVFISHFSYQYHSLQARSDCVVQCANILEPILRVRRDLLLSNGIKEAVANRNRDVKPAICQLLLQSSRLARQESHLQVEWR